MFKIATVNDWYALHRRYPEIPLSHIAVLKHYGVLAHIDFIEQTFAGRGKDVRILEFGHGFAPEVIERFQHRHEVWGADRDQGLAYFKKINWQQMFDQQVAPRCPDVRFVRELLSSSTPDELLPDNSFDCIASISVLEEVSVATLDDIVAGAARKLKPGGYLIGTYDVILRDAQRCVSQYLSAHEKAGLVIVDRPANIALNFIDLLVENPITVMTGYQSGQPPETRQFWGHFGTIHTIARKP